MKKMGENVGLSVIAALSISVLIVAPAAAAPEPFTIYGYVFYGNGTACNNPVVNITNLNTSVKWQAETNATSNYYQLVLDTGTDVNATEILRFNATSPDGSQSNVTNHTVTQDEIASGGIFNFNITLASEAPPGVCGDVTGNGVVNVGDVILLSNYVGYSGYELNCNPSGTWCGDVTGNGVVNVGDVILLSNYVGYSGYELNCGTP